MRRFTFLILALLLALPSVASAYDVLLLLSRRDPYYEEALAGLRQAAGFTARLVTLSDYNEADIPRVIREDRPLAIVAIGDRALALAARNRQAPVVGLMCLSLPRLAVRAPNLTGVDFLIRPEQFAGLLAQLKTRKVGMLYDPARSGAYLQRARQAAGRVGVELVAREVDSAKEVLGQLEQLKGQVGALWMIPDATAVNSRTSEAYFLFSLGRNVPVVSFDRSHLGLGAAVVLEPDRREMGVQAAEMAAALVGGTPLSDLPLAPPRKQILKINRTVLKRLDIPSEGFERLSGYHD